MEIQIYKPRPGDQQSATAEECECPICQETTKDTKTTSCRHTFCVSCLDKWLMHNHTCPMCRTQIQEPPAPRMFNYSSNTTPTRNQNPYGLTFNHPARELLQVYS